MTSPNSHRRHGVLVGKILMGSAAILALMLPMSRAQEPTADKTDFFKVHFAPNTKVSLDSADAEVEQGKARKYTLEECIAMGLEMQPAVTAARASLAGAESAQRGIDRLFLAQFITPDLKIRKQQSCLGIRIAEAGMHQAEWEARYAITRNYYSVIFARQQSLVVAGVVDKLDRAAKTAKTIIDAGDPKSKVTSIDVDNLIINRELQRSRGLEASIGVEKALAALREAIGLGCDQPFDVVEGRLPALVEKLDLEGFIATALATRGEMAQVQAADQIVELEIAAQHRIFGPQGKTFASGADIHAKPIPQGVRNGQYRPEAIGLEMPPSVAGPKHERVAHIAALKDRADAVVVKTEQLIRLEVTDSFLKWKEAAARVKILEKMPVLAQKIADNVTRRFNDDKATGEELLRARTMEDQTQAAFNEALYNHALGLAALERVTAGGYRMPPSQP